MRLNTLQGRINSPRILPLWKTGGRLNCSTRAMLVEDRMTDLVAEQIDVAIRAAYLEDSTLVARKLADNPRTLVASPAYLARAGVPNTPNDLTQHECLLWTRDNRVYDEWPFTLDGVTTRVRVQGRIHVNDGMALAATACAGAGITLMDRLLVEQELSSGELVELLPAYALAPGPSIYAVYPARQWLALNTATFVEFLLSQRFAQRVS
jgi:DNA-binding transcriptional LysR family regulator